MVRRSPTLEFERQRRELDSQFQRIARYEQFRHLQWLDVAEVHNLMLWELWVAVNHFDARNRPGMTMMKYWTTLWRNRKAKLIKSHLSHTAVFNYEAISLDEAAGTGHLDQHVPPCPVPGSLERRVWRALCLLPMSASLMVDIRQDLGITKRMLDGILESFRNAEVHGYLTRGGM